MNSNSSETVIKNTSPDLHMNILAAAAAQAPLATTTTSVPSSSLSSPSSTPSASPVTAGGIVPDIAAISAAAGISPSPIASPSTPPLNNSASTGSIRGVMLDQYRPWVMKTYGDSAKTKTITARKYARIVAHLRSNDKEINETTGGTEDSKFKLWVKTKGFHLGPPAGHPEQDLTESAEMLYIPTGTDKVIIYYYYVLKKINK